MTRQLELNRRQFLSGVGVGASGLAISGCVDPFQPQDVPLIPPEITDDVRLRLLNRITFGPTAAEIVEIETLGYDAFLEQQLHPDEIDDRNLNARLVTLTTLDAPISQLVEINEDVVRSDLVRARVLRAILSRRQLYERMVEFWTEHFTIYQNQEATIFLKTIDDREVIRGHALGNFRDLLRASAQSPAMLVYLNNNVNIAGAPNENYARELLELHTVGVEAGYTQTDVEELARVLTGWTVADEWPFIGQFVFLDDYHDGGAKTVMNLRIPVGGGMDDGEKALDYLARHEQTARFIAGKLVRHFVSESVPQSVVDRVAEAFRTSDGDIRTTLRALFAPESMELAQPKFKRPLHFVASAIRQSGARITIQEDVGDWLYVMGHIPFNWPAPNGYPDTVAFWSPGMLHRWNFAMALAVDEIGTASLDVLSLAERGGATTPEQVVDLWDRIFHAGSLPKTERDAILDYVLREPEDPGRLYFESLATAIATPAYQWA